MKPSSLSSHLFIRGVELCVYLGWPEEERLDEQIVLLDLDMGLPEPPKACVTDDLNDTFCYSDLITDIHEQIGTKSFRLIEHLSYEIYQLIKPRLPHAATLSVRITKHPKIPGLTGGVCFRYGDNELS